MTAVEDQLAEIEARADAATAGPWIIDSLETGEYGLFVDVDPESLGLGCGSKQVAGFLIEPNAAFVAMSRTMLPAAVAVIEAVLTYAEHCDVVGRSGLLSSDVLKETHRQIAEELRAMVTAHLGVTR